MSNQPMFEFQKKKLVNVFPEEIVEKLQSYNEEHWDNDKAKKLLASMPMEELSKKFNDQALFIGKHEYHAELLSTPSTIITLAPLINLSSTRYSELPIGFIMALLRYAFKGELEKPLTVVDYYRVKTFMVAMKTVFSIRKSYSDNETDYYVCNFLSGIDVTELGDVYKEFLEDFFIYGEEYSKTKEYWDYVENDISSFFDIDVIKKYSEAIAKGDNLHTLVFILTSVFLYAYTLNSMMINNDEEEMNESDLMEEASNLVFFTKDGQNSIVRIMKEFEKEFKA